MKKLNCVVCDGCRKVIPAGLRPIGVTSKKGRNLHFCENITCQASYTAAKNRIPKPKVDKTYPSLITLDQAATFIDESNKIEEIRLPKAEAILGWTTGQNQHFPEIQGQVNALKYVFEKYANVSFTIEVVCKFHTILMKNLLQPYELGLRREWVQIGGRLCPAPTAVRGMLKQWCEKVNAFTTPSESDIWKAHLAYEKIHPFIDGNGRSGRLLWLWLRYKHGYNFGLVEDATKYDLYYPQFDTFSFDGWILS